MTITLTPELKEAIAEQAQREGTTPERLVSDSPRSFFVAPKLTPDEILGLVAQMYAGLFEQEVSDVEDIALDRSSFASARRPIPNLIQNLASVNG